MSKTDKQLQRLLTLPKDFSWSELVAVMKKHNFDLYSSSGSGRKFMHKTTEVVCNLHEPHPNKILKPYALKIAINALKQSGELR